MGFIDPNDFESVALDTAALYSVAFCNENTIEITKDDGSKLILYCWEVPPSQWPEQMWRELINTACAGYVSSLQDQAAQAQAALTKVTILPPVGAEKFPAFNTDNMNGEFPR